MLCRSSFLTKKLPNKCYPLFGNCAIAMGLFAPSSPTFFLCPRSTPAADVDVNKFQLAPGSCPCQLPTLGGSSWQPRLRGEREREREIEGESERERERERVPLRERESERERNRGRERERESSGERESSAERERVLLREREFC